MGIEAGCCGGATDEALRAEMEKQRDISPINNGIKFKQFD